MPAKAGVEQVLDLRRLAALTPNFGLQISVDTLSLRVRCLCDRGGGFATTLAYMRRARRRWGAVLALSAPAEAKSCSGRLKTCQGFCAKTEGSSPGCLAKCGEYRQACIASGCWESKYVSKECGFAKQ